MGQQGLCLCGAPAENQRQRCHKCGSMMCMGCATLAATGKGSIAGLCGACNSNLRDERASAEQGGTPGSGREFRSAVEPGKPGSGR